MIGGPIEYKVSRTASPNALVLTNQSGRLPSSVVLGGGQIFITNVTATNAEEHVAPIEYVPNTKPENKVLLSCSSDTTAITVHFEAEGGSGENFTPIVSIGDVSCEIDSLEQISDRYYRGSIDIAITGSGDVDVVSSTGQSTSVNVTLGTRPIVLSVTQLGDLPGIQTELKENDVVSIEVTADMDFKYIEVAGFGAGKQQDPYLVTPATIANIPIYIAAHASLTQSPVKARVITEDGSTSKWFTSGEIFPCNNQRPTFTDTGITYPEGQGALKIGEDAIVDITVEHFDTIEYSSLESQVIIPDPTTYAEIKTVAYANGDYNISTANYRIEATRTANDAPNTHNTVVKIANVKPQIDISVPAARLRSGGENGTVIQSYSVSLTSNQYLIEAPSIVATADMGALIGAMVGSGKSWSQSIQVSDSHTKGDGTFSGLTATNLAGMVQEDIRSGAEYVVGGFVSRDLPLAGFQTVVSMNVMVKTTGNLQAQWLNTGGTLLKSLVFQEPGTTDPSEGGYTIDGINLSDTDVILLDSAIAGWSDPTIIRIEESA